MIIEEKENFGEESIGENIIFLDSLPKNTLKNISPTEKTPSITPPSSAPKNLKIEKRRGGKTSQNFLQILKIKLTKIIKF